MCYLGTHLIITAAAKVAGLVSDDLCVDQVGGLRQVQRCIERILTATKARETYIERHRCENTVGGSYHGKHSVYVGAKDVSLHTPTKAIPHATMGGVELPVHKIVAAINAFFEVQDCSEIVQHLLVHLIDGFR